MTALLLIGAVTGSAVGSFIICCAYRIPRKLSLIAPGSFCPSCRHSLSWSELVPVFSYLLQSGKCRHCGWKIPGQYLLAETASALVAVVFLFRNDLTTQTIGMIVFSWLMILIALIDWNDRIIPNKVLLCGTFLAILYKFFFTNENIIADSAGALIVGALIAGIAWCVSFFLKRQAMGWGDIKFITLITFMTSWQNGLLIIWTSAVIGSLAGIIWKRQRPDLELRIPFGTILAVMTIGSFVIGTLGDWAIRSLSHWVIDPLGH